jgi:hypothetical protein
VPDADVAAAISDSPVERHPCGPVFAVLGAGIRFELIKRSPILNDDLGPHDVSEKAALGTRSELAQHLAHRQDDRKPLVNHPWLVDSHPDEENDKIAFDLGRHSARNHLRHVSPRSS